MPDLPKAKPKINTLYCISKQISKQTEIDSSHLAVLDKSYNSQDYPGYFNYNEFKLRALENVTFLIDSNSFLLVFSRKKLVSSSISQNEPLANLYDFLLKIQHTENIRFNNYLALGDFARCMFEIWSFSLNPSFYTQNIFLQKIGVIFRNFSDWISSTGLIYSNRNQVEIMWLIIKW